MSISSERTTPSSEGRARSMIVKYKNFLVGPSTTYCTTGSLTVGVVGGIILVARERRRSPSFAIAGYLLKTPCADAQKNQSGSEKRTCGSDLPECWLNGRLVQDI